MRIQVWQKHVGSGPDASAPRNEFLPAARISACKGEKCGYRDFVICARLLSILLALALVTFGHAALILAPPVSTASCCSAISGHTPHCAGCPSSASHHGPCCTASVSAAAAIAWEPVPFIGPAFFTEQEGLRPACFSTRTERPRLPPPKG